MAIAASVLTINAGSSSIKFALYDIEPTLTVSMRGELGRIGIDGTTLSWTTRDNGSGERPLDAASAESAPEFLVDWLAAKDAFSSITAAGHRIVHGLARTEPVRISSDVMVELHRAGPYAPDHLPREIASIEALRSRDPDLPQVACFDTAFHGRMPPVARLLPIPRRYYDRGVRRYGFHGLSYAYLIEELGRVAGEDAVRGRVILAHLGNGASLTALTAGTSIDTTMGFTPAAGLVMSTRTGDLDPGVVSFLATADRMTAAEFHHMVNHESGLLGVSELSSDMRDLLAREATDVRAAEALALFCYQAKKWVGAFAAALGGLDTLVFSAGIGERSAPIRARICEGLAFLGIELDDARNQADAAVISTSSSRVTVRIIPTDEELMIARSVVRVLGLNTHRQERDA
ncbi:MAG: acetate/propionate family kinase [Vicinamibacterales bacterium]